MFENKRGDCFLTPILFCFFRKEWCGARWRGKFGEIRIERMRKFGIAGIDDHWEIRI